MKRVEAIIKPFRLDDVKDALAELGVQGMTVTEARGLAQTPGNPMALQKASFLYDFMPKLCVEVIVPDRLVPEVIQRIEQSARTGHAGDGRIIVSPVLEAVRIRTGERGDEAV